ncbi:MAG: hypothetical protein U9O59_07590 [Actinomycetota bacterium]|nr:hypothetical protein [Actinomycetota bacterium]
MNFQLMVFFNLILLLIGVFGIFYSRDIISVFVSLQFIIISGFINFIGFSRFLYQHSLWDKIFIISGVTIIYFLLFCIIYYLYLKNDAPETEELYEEFKIFRIKKEDWWGEDGI